MSRKDLDQILIILETEVFKSRLKKPEKLLKVRRPLVEELQELDYEGSFLVRATTVSATFFYPWRQRARAPAPTKRSSLCFCKGALSDPRVCSTEKGFWLAHGSFEKKFKNSFRIHLFEPVNDAGG